MSSAGKREKYQRFSTSQIKDIMAHADDGGLAEHIARQHSTTADVIRAIISRERRGRSKGQAKAREERWAETREFLEHGISIKTIALLQRRSRPAVCQEADRNGYTSDVRQQLISR